MNTSKVKKIAILSLIIGLIFIQVLNIMEANMKYLKILRYMIHKKHIILLQV